MSNHHSTSKASLLTTHSDSFVHLHLHTQYSLLDGAVRIRELVEKAKEYNMPAVAQTDHGNMFGAIDFYVQCKRAGIKPILGSEIYFTVGSRLDRPAPKKSTRLASQDEEESSRGIYHLILLCKNNKGYNNLCKLISKTYEEGMHYRPRADLELLQEFNEGLICTTSCLKGEVGYNFLIDNDSQAIKAIEKLHKVFKDDFYLEVQPTENEDERSAYEKIIKYARQNNLPTVATNNVHYMTSEDAVSQEVLMCIQGSKTYDDENRPKMGSSEYYFKSPQEMRLMFSELPEACNNTLKIADQCNVDLNWTNEKGEQIYHLPDFPIDTNETEEEYLVRVSLEGLELRFNGPHFKKLVSEDTWKNLTRPIYINRLKEELGMINRMGFAGYFLIVSDFIKWSKSNGIPVGPGRGSGAGSLVAYALEITNINPIPYNLLFERFINPERITMPDFDIDFCQNGRSRVIEYVTQKYGSNNVGQIITFGKLQARAAIKDVSRVFGLTFKEADDISKLIPDELGVTLDKALEKEPKLTDLIETDPKIKQIFYVAKQLEGLYRHAGIHAAGIIITNKPLVEYCPLFKGAKGEQVVQYDKDFSEKIGLVKFDFLGLKTLTVIDQSCRIIRNNYDSQFDIEAIDLEDSSVYEYISEGETIGVFQLESSGMIDLCKRLKPESLEDITAINALYRPGPLESGMVDDFIEIKHGRKKTVYPFPELEPILKDTYGIIVYQEQVMNIARIIAGYSMGQADMLRRAMGKKKAEEMERHRKIFVDGAKEKGFNVSKAEELYQLMAKFAAYGFNKSHAVVYALIAYQTGYLKRYYKVPFFASLLSTEMNNSAKLKRYINNARSLKVNIIPPEINSSGWEFRVDDGDILFGLGAIKGAGEIAVSKLVDERKCNGPYRSFIDFCVRNDPRLVNKRMLEALIVSGAFDKIEKMNRKTLLGNLEKFQAYAEKRQTEKSLGQGTLFANEGSNAELVRNRLEIDYSEEFDDETKFRMESELMSVYVSGHPLDCYADIIKQLSATSIDNIYKVTKPSKAKSPEAKWGRQADRKDLVVCGIITSKREITTKKNTRMLFAALEDFSSKIEMVVFPNVYGEYREELDVNEPIIITGYTRLDEEERKLFPGKSSKDQ